MRANAASDGIVTVGQQFSFVVTIRNTGSTALEVVPLVDNYDTTYLGFVSANPMPDEPADDGSLKWNDLTGTSALAPNDSMVVVITFTAKASTDRLPNKQTINFAVVDGARDVFGQPVPRAEGSAPIRITDPRISISKTVTDPADGLVAVGQEVTFTIRLRNEGDTTIVTIPVHDLYEANILTYVRTSISAPQVTVNGNDGELFWSDVTTSLGDLAPGQQVSFTVTFRLTQPTEGTTNVALVGDDTFDENGDRVQPVQSQAGAEVRGRAEPTPTPTSTPVPGCIVGYKVDDLHVGLPAWVIRTRPSGASSPQYEATTDGTGYFIFPNLTPSRWTVWEVLQEGWVPVTASQFEVTVNPGPTCVQVRFKNRQATPTPTPISTPTRTPTPEGPGGQAGGEIYLPLVTKGGAPTPTPTPEPPGGMGEECDVPGCPIDGLSHPKGLAVHVSRNVLFIVSRDNKRLLKVDPRTTQVLDYASTGDEPWDVVVNENTNRVYVSNFGSGDVWVYNAVDGHPARH